VCCCSLLYCYEVPFDDCLDFVGLLILVFVFCRMGKRKLNESDSDYSDDSDVEGEMEKSDLLNDQNESESTKAEGSLASVTGGGGASGSGSCESGSEEEKEAVVQGNVGCVGLLSDESIQAMDEPVISNGATAMPNESVVVGLNAEEDGHQDCHGGVSDKFDGAVNQASNITVSETVATGNSNNDMEIDGSLEHKAAVNEESSPSTSVPAMDEPLNFDAFNSSAELEVCFQ